MEGNNKSKWKNMNYGFDLISILKYNMKFLHERELVGVFLVPTCHGFYIT